MIGTPKVMALPHADRQRILDGILSGRFGRPEEVADLVAFLIRDDAGYVTAQEIGIDGGGGDHNRGWGAAPQTGGGGYAAANVAIPESL